MLILNFCFKSLQYNTTIQIVKNSKTDGLKFVDINHLLAL